MKKVILTTVIAFATLFASAQSLTDITNTIKEKFKLIKDKVITKDKDKVITQDSDTISISPAVVKKPSFKLSSLKLSSLKLGSCVSSDKPKILIIVGIEKDAEDKYSFESLAENIGFGYLVCDKFMGGLTMTDATSDSEADTAGVITESIAADMQLFARYYATEMLFVSITAPWSSNIEGVSASDMMRLGVGATINVWNNVNVEAGYTMLTSSDVNGDKKGEFKIGLTMNF